MENMLGNILGTHYELKGNTQGTHWETGKKTLFAPQNLKGREARHLGPSHWLKGKYISPRPLPNKT